MLEKIIDPKSSTEPGRTHRNKTNISTKVLASTTIKLKRGHSNYKSLFLQLQQPHMYDTPALATPLTPVSTAGSIDYLLPFTLHAGKGGGGEE